MLRVLGLLGALSLVTGGAPAPAATARAAGTLVFFSQRDPAGGLYAESAAGGPLRLLRTGVRDDGAHWSSDGKHVLFERDGDPVWIENLWVAGADGRGAHVLARNAVQPTWAPDGRQVAFVRNGAIWIIRIDGTRLHRLSDPGDKRDGSARWSPDGRLIAFLRADQSGGPNESRLMTIRPNGSGLRLISHRVFFAPEWSPDSKRIAFDSSSPDGTGDFDPHAYVANVTGRSIRRIGALNNDLSWSPDGRWIAYVGGGSTLSVVRPNGSGRRDLFEGATSYVVPAWSPDSRRLAIGSATGPGQPIDIWVVDVGDRRARRVTDGWRYGYSVYAPTWQPRGLPPSRLGGRVVPPALPTDSRIRNGVLETTRRVTAIAADGGRVAIQYGPGPPAGGSTEMWDPASGAIVRFNLGGYVAPALAGDRVAYAAFEHAAGTNAYGISTATVDTPNPHWLGGLCPPSGIGFCIRDPVGDVVGKGSLIAFDSWKGPEPYCNLPCPPPKHDARLYRVDGDFVALIAASAGQLTPVSVDGDRILVDEGDGSLAVLDEQGTALTTLHAPGEAEARLQGADLVVHAGPALTDYDASTGAPLHTWPVPAGARLEDVQGGVAAYVTVTGVHLLRLADGRDSELRPPGAGPYHAQLEAGGLFYSYAVDDGVLPGRVAFVASAALP